MCNCGKKRNVFTQQNQSINSAKNLQQEQPLANRQPEATVMFEYTGKTALSVIGNFTRRTYRFKYPGDVQHIALNDAAAMSGVPVLKRV